MSKQGYKHLSSMERDRIAVMRAQGSPLSEIGARLGRDKATISRELRRNRPPGRRGAYFSQAADERARARWMSSHQKERIKNPAIRAYLEEKLVAGWSPELIAGRLGHDLPGLSISHETIYQYLYREARRLIPHLTRGGWERRRRGYSRKHGRAHIPGRVDISERPAAVGARSQPGHWEADLMESARRGHGALNVLSERVSRMTLLTKLPDKTSAESSSAIIRRLGPLPGRMRLSVTYDNGAENADHGRVNAALKMNSYFCAPYHSWEKGTVENTVGLVRRWLPKKTELDAVNGDTIVEIERWLNNRPRKCLGYKTPREVFNEMSVALAG